MSKEMQEKGLTKKGEFHLLIEELKLHYDQFQTYFRMLVQQFEASSSSENTNFPTSPTDRQNFAICRL